MPASYGDLLVLLCVCKMVFSKMKFCSWFRMCAPYLQLKHRESSSSSRLSVVLDRRALYDGSESVDWSWGDLCCLGETSCSSSVLSAWLVEVHSDSSLPVLVEVVVRNFVVVFDCLRTLSVYGKQLLVQCSKRHRRTVW